MYLSSCQTCNEPFIYTTTTSQSCQSTSFIHGRNSTFLTKRKKKKNKAKFKNWYKPLCFRKEPPKKNDKLQVIRKQWPYLYPR